MSDALLDAVPDGTQPRPPGAAAPAGSAAGVARARLEDQLGWYDARSASCRTAHLRTKVVQMALAAAVPVLAALGAAPGLTAATGAVVVVLEGTQQLYQWQTNWVLYRATAEALKHEKFLYLAGAGPYGNDDATRVLAERVEGLVSQEHARWTVSRDERRDGDPAAGRG
jgi:hypothetical protein